MKRLGVFVLIIFFVGFTLWYKGFVDNDFFAFPYSEDYFFQKSLATQMMFLDTDVVLRYQQHCDQQQILCNVLPHQQWMTDWIWLRGIQYVGKTIFANHHSQLYGLLDTLTSLSPYWEYPYVFGQHFLPINKNETQFEEGIIHTSWQQAADLGEKGIQFLCSGFVAQLSGISEDKFQKLIASEEANACADYLLPHSLGFTYFYYLQNYSKSLTYYRAAALSPNAPSMSQNMPALVAGRLGHHLKSAYMWHDKFLVAQDSLSSLSLSEQQHQLQQMDLYLKKAVFEYSLQLITQAYQQQTLCIQDYDCLAKKRYLTKQVQSSIDDCQTGIEGKEVECSLLSVGLEKGWISPQGDFVYPLEEGFVYGWRNDVQDWWIIPVNQ